MYRIKDTILFQYLLIDNIGREIYYKNKRIPLTKSEFDIVSYLALSPGQVFSREQIYTGIWGVDALGLSSNITEHVKNIRCKFAKCNVKTTYISTVWGIGYKWNVAKFE